MIKKWIQKIKEAFKDFKGELAKVTFPGREETIGSTTVVIVLTLMVSIFLALVDAVLSRLLRLII